MTPKTAPTEASIPAGKPIQPFSVKQAVVAIDLDSSTDTLLPYFDFFSGHIPVSGAFFVHVLPRLEVFSLEHGPDYLIPIEESTEINEDVLAKMEQEVKKHIHAHGKMFTELNVRVGDPLQEVLADTEEFHADLVVIGQDQDRGEHGILDRNLVRKVRGNALIVPDGSKRKIKHILVPIDFSQNSVRALRVALGMRKQMKESVKITCLHVFEMPNMSFYRISRSPKQVRKMIEENIQEGMDAFLNSYAGGEEKGIRKVLVNKDVPGIAGYINDTAHKLKADFIVMGAKGHSKVELLLLGSVSERLLDLNEDIPTLIVK